jgi:hypothetical protein
VLALAAVGAAVISVTSVASVSGATSGIRIAARSVNTTIEARSSSFGRAGVRRKGTAIRSVSRGHIWPWGITDRDIGTDGSGVGSDGSGIELDRGAIGSDDRAVWGENRIVGRNSGAIGRGNDTIGILRDDIGRRLRIRGRCI